MNGKRVNVLLAHGGDERHIPFKAAKIHANGFDYLAAGHIHRGGWLLENRAVMAGSLEPTDCNDTGVHGYWMGELEKGRADVHFYPIKKCQYCHEIYEVSPTTTDREVTVWAEGLLQERPSYQYFRLFLKGRRDPETEFSLDHLMGLDRIVDITEELVPDLDYGKLREAHSGSLLAAYIDEMDRRESDAVTKKALEYGVNALLGYEICR